MTLKFLQTNPNDIDIRYNGKNIIKIDSINIKSIWPVKSTTNDNGTHRFSEKVGPSDSWDIKKENPFTVTFLFGNSNSTKLPVESYNSKEGVVFCNYANNRYNTLDGKLECSYERYETPEPTVTSYRENGEGEDGIWLKIANNINEQIVCSVKVYQSEEPTGYPSVEKSVTIDRKSEKPISAGYTRDSTIRWCAVIEAIPSTQKYFSKKMTVYINE